VLSSPTEGEPSTGTSIRASTCPASIVWSSMAWTVAPETASFLATAHSSGQGPRSGGSGPGWTLTAAMRASAISGGCRIWSKFMETMKSGA